MPPGHGLESANLTPSDPSNFFPSSSTCLTDSPLRTKPAYDNASSSCRLSPAICCSVFTPSRFSRQNWYCSSFVPFRLSQAAYAATTATWSEETPDLRAQNFRFSSPRTRSSCGDRKGDRVLSAAEMIRLSSVTPKIVPSRISFPNLASMGNVDRCTPSGVRSSQRPAVAAVMASSDTNSSTARATASADGGSSRRPHTSAAEVPECRYTGSARMRNTSCSNATRRTSGSCAACAMIS
mmetsp:Transcript_31168/g.78047  ORF Transcript_31168/g.78047 Transcript_31168/m.78047 type:complete len:238 (+) Transcript_31168:1646-2359(+)